MNYNHITNLKQYLNSVLPQDTFGAVIVRPGSGEITIRFCKLWENRILFENIYSSLSASTVFSMVVADTELFISIINSPLHKALNEA